MNGFTDIAVRQLPHSAFAGIEPTQPRGNLGRNTFRKDGVANVKLGLSRIWNLAGDQSLMFRVESPNLFNTPQFAEPDHNAASLNFGEITNTLNDEGAFRFTLQFSF